MDLSLIDNITFVYDDYDAPDYADAYIESADYDGVSMTEDQLDELSSDFIYEKLIEYLF